MQPLMKQLDAESIEKIMTHKIISKLDLFKEFYGFTDSEVNVLNLYYTGGPKRNKDIRYEIRRKDKKGLVHEKTVKFHFTNIFRKMKILRKDGNNMKARMTLSFCSLCLLFE